MGSGLYCYKAVVEKVIDGDTIDVCIDLGFKVFIKERLRLYGVDAYESRTTDKKEKAKGLKAKAFVKSMIKGKQIELKTTKQGKYGRYLAVVWYDGGAITKYNLNEELIKREHAVEYFGGAR